MAKKDFFQKTKIKLEDVLSKNLTSSAIPIKHKSTHKSTPIKQNPIINIENFENITKNYEPKKIASAFNDKYMN